MVGLGMAMIVWSSWDKNEVAMRGRSGPGTVMLALEYVLVIWSGIGGFSWSRVGPEWWAMALMVLNIWGKYGMARKVRDWLGTALVVLENVLVVWSGLGDFDWSRVVLEWWVMVVMVWSGCDRHVVARIDLSRPLLDLVDQKGSGRLWVVHGGSEWWRWWSGVVGMRMKLPGEVVVHGPGTVMFVLEWVLVTWSGLAGGFDWSRVGLERWMMAWTCWDRCRMVR